MLTMSIQIIPAILTDDIDDFEEKLKLVEQHVDRVQIDYVDGYFSPEVSCCEARYIREIDTQVGLEVHLMVVDPASQVRAWAETGVERIIGHIEEMEDQVAFVEKVAEYGLSVGLALNLDTSLSHLEKSLLPSLDVVLLMAHEVGIQGGTPLNPDIFARIKKLKEMAPHVDIEVDGGVNSENAAQLVEAGASILAVGSDIFADKDPLAAIQELQEAVI